MNFFPNRIISVLLVILVLGSVIVGRGDFSLVDDARMMMWDGIKPTINTLSRPFYALKEWIHDIEVIYDIYKDGLASYKAKEKEWKNWEILAKRLDLENRQLRRLLNVKDFRVAKFVTGRVIADVGSSFVHSALLTAGQQQGVYKGQAVTNQRGLVGRIISSGHAVSRVLLVTDMNSRIPIQILRTGDRAILSGQNTSVLKLRRLISSIKVQVGDQLITSGHGGVFPKGIPVGRISKVTDRVIEVTPVMRRHRLDWVRIVDYGLQPVLKDVPLNLKD